MKNMQIGDFGYFEFTATTRTRKRGTVIMGYSLFATVTEVESKQVLITDNDGFVYLVDKKDIKLFRKEIFADKNK
jgi:hypothetical protein